jgi:hypothetical protein
MSAPPASRPSRPRRHVSGQPASDPARRRKTLLALGGAGALALGGMLAYHQIFLSDAARHHAYALQWPEAAPRGEPIAVAKAPPAGETYVTRWESAFRIVLSVDPQFDTKQGMNLDVALLAGHGVAPKGDGAGLESTWRVVLDTARSTPTDLASKVRLAIGRSAPAYVLKLARDPSGAQAGRLEFGPLAAIQRTEALDGVLCGLGDVTTCYLPPRPVRLGEVWTLDEVAPFPGIAKVVRYVSREDEFKGGFPELTVRSAVAAETVEKKDGEECVRCRLVVYVAQNGEVKPPALVGRISTAAKIEGQVWASVSKGILWACELESEITTSYLCERPTERRATATLRAKTEKADALPQ